MKTVYVEPRLIDFIQAHDTAVAIALLFAFCAAVFLSPNVTK